MIEEDLNNFSQVEAMEPDLRIVLVGKTGVGKSATGNTILGREVFKSSLFRSPTSLCQKETGEFEGQTLVVVDTPGLFRRSRTEEEVLRERSRCISFAAPGPHAFLAVINSGSFTEEDQKTVTLIQEVFGEGAANYMVVLFTHGDDLEREGVTMEELFIRNANIRAPIQQCRGRYHVFNNRTEDPSQVRGLMRKINRMVRRNGGFCYNNRTFRKAARAIEKAKRLIMSEHPDIPPEEVRCRAENTNTFIYNNPAVPAEDPGFFSRIWNAGASVLNAVARLFR